LVTHCLAVRSQTLPPEQAGLQPSTHFPSTQTLPDPQLTPTQESTHSYSLKLFLGLHSLPVGHVPALQGLSRQEPRLQTLPQPWHPVSKQLSITHSPALAPKVAQTLPDAHCTPEHGSSHPTWELQTQMGV
jgi:hypothetical protein